MQVISSKIHGVLCTILIAILSLYLQKLPIWPFTLANGSHPLEAVMIALILGILISALIKIPQKLSPGIKFSSTSILNLSVILLGARLNFNSIINESYKVILIIIICVIISFISTLLICKLLKISSKLAILIGVGTAICGSAAIAVAAPTIKAEEHDIGLSIAAINILGLIAIFTLPALSVYLSLSHVNAGAWMGLSIQAVAQTVAAGFSYNNSVGAVAVIVKLARVLLLAPMIILISIWHKKQEHKKLGHLNLLPKTSWTRYIPPFILLFILLMTLNSLGFVADFQIAGHIVKSSKTIEHTSGFLMAMALGGIGLNTNLKKILKTGIKPLIASLISAVILASMALALVQIWL